MLSNLKVTVAAVLPMFITIAVGFLAKRLKFINDEEVRRFNNIIFTMCAPCLTFSNVYGQDLKSVVDGPLIAYIVCALITVYIGVYIIVCAVEKEPKSRGAMIHGTYRSNTALMGLPLAINILGAGGAGLTAMSVSIIVPLQNFLAVFTLERFRGGKVNVKQIIKGVVTNPFILGAAAGFVTVLLRINLPTFIESPINAFSQLTSTMALFLLGASLEFNGLKRNLKRVIGCSLGRLFIIPAAVISVGAALGFRGAALVAIVAMFASPTAVMTFTMAQKMDSNAELARDIVMVTSVFSAFTMFLSVFILKQYGLI